MYLHLPLLAALGEQRSAHQVPAQRERRAYVAEAKTDALANGRCARLDPLNPHPGSFRQGRQISAGSGGSVCGPFAGYEEEFAHVFGR